MTKVTHPFGSYIPRHATLLVLGSFPPKALGASDFFYASKQNQFWRIILRIYGTWLPETWQKKRFCDITGIAMVDIIATAVRKDNNSSDQNLAIEEVTDISGLLERAPNIRTIACTSRFVREKLESHFDKLLQDRDIDVITLPSPSPRYARMSIAEKARRYEEVFHPTFAQKVYSLLLTIPEGKVTTYKAIAERLGTKAYRAVGQALNNNFFAPAVPCHRVIQSDCSLGGFASGRCKKQEFLEREGVRFEEDGRIDPDCVMTLL